MAAHRRTAGGAASTQLARSSVSTITLAVLSGTTAHGRSMRSQAFGSSSLSKVRKSFSTAVLQSWQATHLVLR